MSTKRLVSIILAISLIALGVGILSLKYNDGHKFINPGSRNIVNIKSDDGVVRIGNGGIEVKDGDDRVQIGWDGINIRDGEEEVNIGWKGIKINGVGQKFNNKNNWFNFSSNNLKSENINDERIESIDGINSISIISNFVDIKITSEDRDDVRIHYYGKMKSNILPNLDIERTSDNLKIEVSNPDQSNYTVVESDLALEVFIPKTFKGSFSSSTSSGDIYMKNLIGDDFHIASNSGDQELENIEAKTLNISSSSGEIEIEDSIGELNIVTSSGDISLDNKKTSGNIKIATKSGDVSIKLSNDASYKVSGSTSSGDIDYDGPMSMEEDRTRQFEFTLGSGDKSIIVNTHSGDIEFNR